MHLFSLSTKFVLRPIAAVFFVCIATLSLRAQQAGPIIVQPGAPGQPTRVLPSSTRAKLPPASKKNIEFMQGMIVHHQQAVVMTAFIDARTSNSAVRLIGGRISQSQSDEMKWMQRWLESRGQPSSPSMTHSPESHVHGAHAASHHELMPGMLTAEQMETLEKSTGVEFDRLFLKGMIQHHNGALMMVKDLFETAGAGQDAELFAFATDVDSGQRAEIKSMQTLLAKIP